jgi:hypothetical protein
METTTETQERLTIAEREIATWQARAENYLEQATQAESNARDQIARVRDNAREQLERLQARIDEMQSTEQGQAVIAMETAQRERDNALTRVEHLTNLMQEAERDRDHALASVADGEDIHPHDPRVAHIWRKASRIATSGGYCSEYDRIAEALGIPDMEVSYSGYIEVTYSGTVSVPVSGTAPRSDIANGDIEYDISESDIIEHLDSYCLNYEIQEVSIDADDEG